MILICFVDHWTKPVPKDTSKKRVHSVNPFCFVIYFQNSLINSAILRCSLFRQGFLVALKVGLRCLLFLVIYPIDRDFGSKFGCLLQNFVGEERSFLLRMTASVFRQGVIAHSKQREGRNRKQRTRYFYGSRQERPCA